MSRGRNELLAKHAGDHRLRHDRGRAVPQRARFHLYLSWGGFLLIGTAAALVLPRGEGLRALVLGAFLAFSAPLVASRRFLPLPFSLLFVLACLLGAAGYMWPALNDLRFYDNFAHLLMTFALAPALGLLLYRPMLDGLPGTASCSRPWWPASAWPWARCGRSSSTRRAWPIHLSSQPPSTISARIWSARSLAAGSPPGTSASAMAEVSSGLFGCRAQH